MRIFILFILFLTSLYSNINSNHATILLYHHISDKTPKSTSVAPETFEEHLNYLYENNYKVWDIHKILNYLKNKKELPAKVVAITFDDAYKSIYTNAYKILKKYNYPFTIYVNTAPIGKTSIYLTWDEINLMSKDLATLGSHSHYHEFMIRDIVDYEKVIFNDLLKSNRIIKEKCGVDVKTFAYPFGEYTIELENIVKKFYEYALVQQSGSIDESFNPYQIPRFSMTSNYGTLERFISILNIKPLNFKLLSPSKRIFKSDELANYKFTFSIESNSDYNLFFLNCFDSKGEKLAIVKNRDTSQVDFPDWKIGREKINCTVPSKSNPKIFYWHSEVFYIKSLQDEWYKP